MGNSQLTSKQQAAKLMWYLAHGEGIPDERLRALLGVAKQEEVARLLVKLQAIADIQRDAAGVWSMTGSVRLTGPFGAEQRAAILAALFVSQGRLANVPTARLLGIGRTCLYCTLDMLSLILPIYQPKRGWWAVCTGEDEE